MEYLIEAVNDESEAEMVNFLKQREDYTLFLLGNFEDHGYTLTLAPNSGNYKLIRSGGEILGVFCLTRRGSLLIETSLRESIFETILTSCQAEEIPFTGIIGNWIFCEPFWEFLKNRNLIEKEIFKSKEILYSLEVSKISLISQQQVRVLNEADYDQWKPMRLDYLAEEGLPNNLTEVQMRDAFFSKVKQKITWGYFDDNILVSIADLNAKAFDLGQLGGVYTAPNYRKRGYSKSVVKQP
jgi:hypothetical protein